MNSKYYNNTVGAILYLVIPIVLFFLTWLRWYIGVPFSILLMIVAICFIRDQIQFSTMTLRLCKTREAFVASIIILIFLLLTGQGTFIGSAGFDTPWRLAMYHDLVEQSWPVIYEYSHSALIYYLAFWLVPAGISSLLGLGETGQNLLLITWSYIGIRLFIALLWDYLQLNRKQIIPITIFFLFWGGMNTVGMLLMDALGIFQFQIDTEWGFSSWWFTSVTTDGYRMAYMIRTVFDSLANTYNQFIATILATILFLKYKKVKYLAFLGLLLVPYSPIGFIGLFFLMIVEVVRQGWHAVNENTVVRFFKDVFSKENILTACTVFPVFLLYFMANGVVDYTTNMEGTRTIDPTFGILSAPLYTYGIVRIFVLLLYYLLFFLIFMRLCYKKVQDRTLFWSVFITLSLIPLFKIGNSADFCFNASVPGFFIVMIMMMKEFLRFATKPSFNKRSVVLVTVLIIAMLTTVLQMASAYKKCLKYDTYIVKTDIFEVGGTFSDKPVDVIEHDYKNFTNTDFMYKPFYQYLAKVHTSMDLEHIKEISDGKI